MLPNDTEDDIKKVIEVCNSFNVDAVLAEHWAKGGEIIAFVAALSYVNYLMEQIDYLGSFLIIFGIFSGSFIWWLVLCSISIKFKERLTSRLIRKINLISGGLIFVFGILLVISIKGI